MAKDNRRVITWTHIETSSNYRNDIQKYNHKIYSIGLHEFGADEEGKIYDYNTGDYKRESDGTLILDANGNKQPLGGFYFDNGVHRTNTKGIPILFPKILEDDIVTYPSIKWYLQMIIFSWAKVKPFLANNVVNSEGRLPQDQFCYELDKIIKMYEFTRDGSGTPLNLTGIEMDVEASMTADTVSQGYDELYIRFLEKIKNEVIIPNEMRMRCNVHGMWGNVVPYWYRFHNYKMFAESADKNGNATIDEIQLMTYDYAYNGSAAGASTPIWWFKNVGEWCVENFDPAKNPNAKLTIDNLYFGAAGYGHRWGMHNQEVVKAGSNVTFHNLLDWQNGKIKHFHTEVRPEGWVDPETGSLYTVKNADGTTAKNPDGTPKLVTTGYIYHDQEFLFQTSFQDPESKNEIMYPHVYEMYKPKYVKVKEQDGGRKTATVGNFNLLDYAATNFKLQMPIWTNVRSIANIPSSVSGKGFATNPAEDNLRTSDSINYPKLRTYDPNLNPDDLDFGHMVKSVDGVDKVFVGYYTLDRQYMPNADGTACVMEDEPEARINYTVNVPSSANYRVIALTSFSWYSQAKIGGVVNGQQFTVGGNEIPEWYPHFLKAGGHWFDCGSFSLAAGSNTITVQGELSDENTPIYGFVVCDAFDANFSGGELTMNSNIKPFKKKDGTNAALPDMFAIAAKMLRRDSRPAILWDDEFRTYGEDNVITGKDDKGVIQGVTYYRQTETGFTVKSGGTNLVQTGTNADGKPTFDCRSIPKNVGYSQGIWKQKDYQLHFDSDESEKLIGARSAQLVLSKEWSVNLSIEARMNIVKGAQAGVRFYAQTQGTVADGYVFRIDLERGVRELIYEDKATGTWKVVASQPNGNVGYGDLVNYKVLLYGGVAQCFVGSVQAFIEDSSTPESLEATKVTHDGSVDKGNGKITLVRTAGACGIYANDCEMICDHLGIGTLDRWETLEKFEIIVDGQVKKFGQINRAGYTFDEFGYLIYSGLSEKSTRDATQFFGEDNTAVSLDYEVTVLDWEQWAGAKEIKIKLRDAGVWFGELLIGDREGMSIIWAGDAWSFLDAMNRAVDDYGAKGIGLWAMGQEDPKVWELIPDVVPKK